MSPLMTGVLGILLLFILFATGMPIAFVMAVVGWLGYVYLGSLDAGLHILGLSFYAGGTTYTLSVPVCSVPAIPIAVTRRLARSCFNSMS